MSGLKNYGGALLLVAILLLFFACLPLGTAIQFGGDEGYELMKAFLQLKGFELYREIWSDQPPGFTLLLEGAFRLFGASVLTARCVTAGFGMLLILCLCNVVRMRIGTIAAWFAVFFLLASPEVLELSVSAMQEVPTFGTVMVSVWLLFCWGRSSHRSWLWASGAVMGLALEIKFVAALVIPAMLTELVLVTHRKSSSQWRRRTVLNLLRWGLAVVLVFAAIGLIWGEGSLQTSLSAHFGNTTPNRTDIGGETPDDFAPSPALFLHHADCSLLAVAGIFLVLKRRRLREFALPILWLLTALAVHSVHRPWWPYYYLHLAIPLAWLAGFTASEATGSIYRYLQKGRWHPTASGTWKGVLVCGLMALALARSMGRLESSVQGLRQRPRVKDSALITEMKKHAATTHRAYADNPIYAFHARVLVPPELAVVTLKRFWSGQITTEEIVDTCHRRQVEQLLLGSVSRQDAHWTNTLASVFTVAYQEEGLILYMLVNPATRR